MPDLLKPNKFVTLCMTVVTILLVAATGRLLWNFVTNHGVLYERSRLKARAVALADSLDAESIRTLAGSSADEGTPAFRQLLTQLRSFQKVHGDIRFIYLMGLKGSKVIFLLDSTDPSSVDYSPPGEEYADASPELLRAFTTGEPFVEGPLIDEWGIWVSGLTPIIDPSSKHVIAVLGLDINATRWRVTLWICRVVACLLTGLLAWILFFFSKRIQSRLTKS